MEENLSILRDIKNNLSLRKPQAKSLEILAKVAAVVPMKKNGALGDRALPSAFGRAVAPRPPNFDASILSAVQAICPSVTDFDRDFCSLCFALATGVGKTRLMGAFISYLHEAHGVRNFVVIAPNLTIYNNLISDFTPGTKKYVFQGIRAFASNAPIIITGETYQSGKGVLSGDLFKDSVVINIFNISKLTAKDKGHLDAKDEKAKVARIRRRVDIVTHMMRLKMFDGAAEPGCGGHL